MLPFSMLDYKLLFYVPPHEGNRACDNTAMMEQVIMKEAKSYNKKVKGLETMSYQGNGVLDSIPYKLQAEQLVEYIGKTNSGESDDTEMNEMFKAYKEQDLKKLENLLIATDAGMAGFTDVCFMSQSELGEAKITVAQSLLIAVSWTVCRRKELLIYFIEGYKLTPVANKGNRA